MLLHCRIFQATVTNSCVDERKLQNSPRSAVAYVRGETDPGVKTKRPDGFPCIAEMLACMRIQMKSSEQTFQRNSLPQDRVVSVVAESEKC